MPRLFSKNKTLAPMTKEQAIRKQAAVDLAHKTVEEYNGKLKLLPHGGELYKPHKEMRERGRMHSGWMHSGSDYGSEALYKKREKLVGLRTKELHRLLTNPSYQENQRIKKIEDFTKALQAAIRLLDELQILKKAIDNPANDVSQNKIFRDNKEPFLLEMAKQFIPTVKDVYNEFSLLAYDFLREHDLHHSEDKSEDKKGLVLATGVVQHVRKAVGDPQNKANISILLKDTKTMSKHIENDDLRFALGTIAGFVGFLIAYVGLIMLLSGVLAPAGAALMATGAAICFAASAVSIASIKTNFLQRSDFEHIVSHLDHLTSQASKLFPAPPTDKKELHHPAKERQTTRRFSV